MSNSIDKNLNMENLESSELEQISGGEITEQLDSQSQPQQKDGELCPDMNQKVWSVKIRFPGLKEKYNNYCFSCKNWGRTYCKKGHF